MRVKFFSALLIFPLLLTTAASAAQNYSGILAGAEDQSRGLTHASVVVKTRIITHRCSGTDQVSPWVGLEGRGFAQLGLTFTPHDQGAWYEVFDAYGHTTEVNIPLRYNLGDRVRLALWFNAAHTKLHFSWRDLNHGWLVRRTLSRAHRWYGGQWAEFLVERHSKYLGQFRHPIYLSHASYGGPHWTRQLHGTNVYDMVGVHHSLDADANIPRPGAVAVHWRHCG
jgi:hypothetical protein